MRAGPGPGGRPQRDVRKPLARHASHGGEEAVEPQAGLLSQPPVPVQPATFAPQARPSVQARPAPGAEPFAHPVDRPFGEAPDAVLPPVAPVAPGPLTTALPTALNYGTLPAPAAYADPTYQEPFSAEPFSAEPGFDDGYRMRSAAAETDGVVLPSRRDRRDGASHRTGPPAKGSAPVSALGAAVEVVVVVALALVLAVVVKSFLVQAFYIPSESMEDTLLVGDRVLVSKLTPGPFDLHHGDVVVFEDSGTWLTPSAPPQEGAVRHGLRSALTFIGLLPADSSEHLIKRVVGLPGDTVKCCDVKGRLIVNGVAVDEPYLRPGVAPSEQRFTVTVPADRLWVMGDNRPFSADSRSHMNLPGGGTVPVSDVVGKAFVIVWPFSRAGGLGIPDSVFGPVPPSSGGS